MEKYGNTPHERRTHSRLRARLPVIINGEQSYTINVSSEGFCLELSHALDMNTEYAFEIHLAIDQPVYFSGIAKVLQHEIGKNHHRYGMQVLNSEIKLYQTETSH